MFHLKGCTLGWFRSEGVDCCRNNRLYPTFHILWLEVVSVGGPGLVDYLLCSCKCHISLFQEMYELLAILDFNNERKRMSVSCKIKKKTCAWRAIGDVQIKLVQHLSKSHTESLRTHILYGSVAHGMNNLLTSGSPPPCQSSARNHMLIFTLSSVLIFYRDYLIFLFEFRVIFK